MDTLKNREEIYQDLKNDFYHKTEIDIRPGTAIDLYNLAVSGGIEETYEEIEANRNPHIFSRLRGEELDDTGWMLNLPREENEDDQTYLYRITNWILSSQRSNTTAINSALLNLEHSSNARFVPLTNGSGTGTIYIIPNDYSDEQKELAIKEAREKIKDFSSPFSYIDYVIPRPIRATLHVYMDAGTNDPVSIINILEEKIKEYINNIPPEEKMNKGDINRIGIREPGVQYFNVMQWALEGQVMANISIAQQIHTKLFLDEILWTVEGV